MTEPLASADGVGHAADEVTVRPEALEALAPADALGDLGQSIAREPEALELGEVAHVVGDARDLVVAELKVGQVGQRPHLVGNLGQADPREVQPAALAPSLVDARDDLAGFDGQALKARIVEPGLGLPAFTNFFSSSHQSMVRSKLGGGAPSVRASEALLRIASVSSKLGGGASEALAVRGARGGVSPRRRGPCRRPHFSADAAEDVTAPMLAAIARHGRGAALAKSVLSSAS